MTLTIHNVTLPSGASLDPSTHSSSAGAAAGAASAGSASGAPGPAGMQFMAYVNDAQTAVPASAIQPQGAGPSPMDKMAGGLMDSLQSVADRQEAVGVARGESAADAQVNSLKDALLPGPAELRPMTEGGPAQPAMETRDLKPADAMALLADTFDYAVETHVVVKSVSQFSTSANSLLKSQ